MSLYADAELGFFVNHTSVHEGDLVVTLIVGVLAGNLNEMVDVSFTTVAGTAEGIYFPIAMFLYLKCFSFCTILVKRSLVKYTVY